MSLIEDIQKKIFLLNMAFISSSEVENIYMSWVAKPRMKYTYFSLHEWNKKKYSPFQDGAHNYYRLFQTPRTTRTLENQ